MKPGQLMGLAALAGGAFFLYSKGYLDQLLGGAVTPDPQTPQTPVNEPQTPATPTNTTANAFNLRNALLAEVRKYGDKEMLTFDGWNFYYTLVRGSAGPSWDDAVELHNKGREYKMTIDEYLASATPLGVAGLGNYMGTRRSPYISLGKGKIYDYRSPMHGHGLLYR